jgi:aryl-alcohol dehydrogenase-like predicted oxidoreductase
MSGTPKLPTRQLGKDGPQVTSIGFGLMGLSAFMGSTEPDEQKLAVLDQALAIGENNWDTADVYLDSEDLLGKWFKRSGKRDEVFLATKFSWDQLTLTPEGGFTLRSDPEYVKQACAKSLERMGIDCIDLYYCHRVSKSYHSPIFY